MRLLPPLCVAALLTGGAAGSAPGPRVTAMPEGGGRAAWVAPVAGEAAAGAPLLVPRFAPSLPPLSIPLLGGGTFRTADQRGKVLLLDVWASWCEPCKVELPHLNGLVQVEGPRGLVAIAINAQEPEEVAARAAAEFGIRVPVGLYTDAVDEALSVRALPAVLLVDRQGLVRARWDGYRAGLEQEIAARTRALLDEDPDSGGERVGEVRLGAGTLVPRSWRELPFPATGAVGVGSTLILQGASALWAIEADGGMRAGPGIPEGGGRLLAADLDGDGNAEVVSWRRARPEVLVADLAGGEPLRFSAPGPVMDVAVLPGGRLALATMAGLALADRAGSLRPVPGSRAALALARSGTTLWAVDAGTRRPRRFLLEGDALVEQEVPAFEGWPADAWEMRPGGPGFLVAPSGVELASGSFTARGRREVAVRSGASEIAVLDAQTGERRFGARLDAEVAQIAPLDLEGDGVDELAIATSRGVLILGAGAR